jgi:hypothetical protein
MACHVQAVPTVADYPTIGHGQTNAFGRFVVTNAFHDIPNDCENNKREIRVGWRSRLDYDADLLFGELGWLMGQYPRLSEHDGVFLDIADLVADNDPFVKTRIIDLLVKIEDEGYVVDWGSCVLVSVKRQSWWKWLKAKALEWIRFLVR